MWLFRGKLLLVGLLLSLSSFGQQDPMYSMYMNNLLAINPGYAGSKDGLFGQMLFRSQWMQIDGAPNTQTFCVHSPILSETMGVGLNFVSDQIGPSKRTNVYGSYAYKLRYGVHTISVGLQAGFTSYVNDWSDLTIWDVDDPAFADGIERFTLPNFGFGAHYDSPDWFAGFSMPYILEPTFDKVNPTVTAQQKRHYYAYVGTRLELSSHIYLKPWVVTKLVQYGRTQFDINASFIFDERYLLGATARTNDGMSLTGQIELMDDLWLGYAYDFPLTKLRNYTWGSHEVSVSYIRYLNKPKVMSPRYF